MAPMSFGAEGSELPRSLLTLHRFHALTPTLHAPTADLTDPHLGLAVQASLAQCLSAADI